MEEFKRYLAVNYGNRIERYDQQKVEIVGERKEPRGDVTIQSVVRGGEFEGATVDYRLRESDGQLARDRRDRRGHQPGLELPRPVQGGAGARRAGGAARGAAGQERRRPGASRLVSMAGAPAASCPAGPPDPGTRGAHARRGAPRHLGLGHLPGLGGGRAPADPRRRASTWRRCCRAAPCCSIAVIDYVDNDLGDYHEVSIALFVRPSGGPGPRALAPQRDRHGAREARHVHRPPAGRPGLHLRSGPQRSGASRRRSRRSTSSTARSA